MSAPIPHNVFVLAHVRNLFADWNVPVREVMDNETSGYTITIADGGDTVKVIFFVAMRYADRLGNELKAELATCWLRMLRNLLDKIEVPSYLLPAEGNGGYYKLHIRADELMRLRVENLPGDHSDEDAQPAPLIHAQELLDLPTFQLMHNLLGEGKPHVVLPVGLTRGWVLDALRQADHQWLDGERKVMTELGVLDVAFNMRKVRALMRGTRFHTQFMQDYQYANYKYGYILLWVGEFRRSRLTIDQDMINEMQARAMHMFEQPVDYERHGDHELILFPNRNLMLCERASAREAAV